MSALVIALRAVVLMGTIVSVLTVASMTVCIMANALWGQDAQEFDDRVERSAAMFRRGFVGCSVFLPLSWLIL